MLNKILTSLYHFFWYAFAFIILNAAVAVTVLRLALPEIGSYKTEIQSWVSKQMKHPVVIDKITAEWQGWTPNLYLGNIDLYTQDNTSVITRFDSAQIGIDLIDSVRALTIIPSYISVSGLDFDIFRHADGSMSINSVNDQDVNRDKNNNAALSGWLLKQKHIVLEDASVTWHDEKTPDKDNEFSNAHIELKTDKNRLQLEANIKLPEQYGQSLNILLDVTGNILTPEWSGSAYFDAKQFKPNNLLDLYPIKSINGSANFKLWTRWKKSRLVDFNGEANYSDFLVKANKYDLPVKNIDLKLFGERKEDSDWLLNIIVNNLQTEHGMWPSSNHQLIIEDDSDNKNRYNAYFSYLKLEEILPVLIAGNIISDQFRETLEQQTISAELNNVSISYSPASNSEEILQFNSEFKNLDYTSSDKNFSIFGLEGSLSINNENIQVQLDTELPKIKLGALYDEPLFFSALKADIEIIKDDPYKLILQNLELASTDLSIYSTGAIQLDKANPFIDVVMHIDETNIENISNYLPKQTKPELRNWFNQALAGGKILSSDLIFHGYLNDYPFNNAEGNFKAIFNIENTTLDYNEQWPAIDNFTAEIIIINDDLSISSHSGYIFDAKINELSAEIKDLSNSEHQLNIIGSLSGHTSDAKNFIRQSPINENKAVSELMNNIAGEFALNLKLDIPLGHHNTSVDGLVNFSDTTIESNLPGLSLEKVNGEVHFTNHQVWAKDIDALYYGKPVKLSIPKIDKDGPYSEIFEISGLADKAFILNQLGNFFPSFTATGKILSNYFDGESNWVFTIKKTAPENNISARDVELRSDLNGIEINLPYPFGKNKLETKPLIITTRLADVSINNINFNYNDNFFTDVMVDNSNNLMINNILIGLGQQHHQTTENSDISIQGTLEKLDLFEWANIINIDNIVTSQNNKPAPVRKIVGNINIGEFQILENSFNDINLKLSNSIEGWKIYFDGDDIKGYARFLKGHNNQNDKLLVDLETLSLEKNENVDSSKKSDIDKIPELDIKVGQFTYNNNQLGELQLVTNNIKDGINISSLGIKKPGINIKAEGTWRRIDNIDRSEFNAQLESDSISTMLNTFNYTSANIEDGKTLIEMNASWMDTPMNFSIEKINGELDMQIEKGRFLDIDPSAGRLFGLLSIQTLPRRLSLDFTDLFNKGFAFDSISGNFNLEQGHAYTNNLELIGPAANITVTGRTGLVNEDYDQIATITPKFSNSLPVASALFGPIGVGVGAVIYLTGELFKSIPDRIDDILRYQYSIKGSWDDPDIVKIKKDSKSG